jgi:hypothetical protein
MYWLGLESWLSRAPEQLVIPYLHAQSAIQLLSSVHWNTRRLPEKVKPRPEADKLTAVLRKCSVQDIENARLAEWRSRLTEWADRLAKDMVRLRDTAAKGRNSLAEVEEEFGAVADGISNRGRLFASSVHRLVLDLSQHEVREIIEAVNFGVEEEDADAYSALCSGFHPDDISPCIEAVAESIPEALEAGISWDEYYRLTVQLEQELFRAWKRKYPTDSAKFKTFVRDSCDDPHLFDVLSDPTLSEAERKILKVIQSAGHRVTTDEIVGEIERQFGAASLGTTKQCLASLRRRTLLTNRQDESPKGYGLPEWD